MENKETDFCERLSELLDEKQMTRADLARYFNTSQSTVFSWFRQGYKPSLDYAVKLSKFFNVNIEWLASGEGEKVKDPTVKAIADDKKYAAVKLLWDKLSEWQRKELMDFGNFLLTK